MALVAPGGRVAIVGAGSAGLAAARAMRDAGFVPTVFERGVEVGGTWNYKHETSAMYAGLRCNIPKECMQFRNVPFGDTNTGTSYATHAEVQDYLVEFSHRFRLRPHIRFGHKVDTIQLEDDDKDKRWIVNGKYAFDAVCVANGHFSVPNSYFPPGTPKFIADGKRTVTHSKNYRTPERYVGRKVVIVGASASGTDIALELERSGVAQVYLSHNDAHWNSPNFAATIPQVATIKCLTPDGTVHLIDGTRITGVDDVLLCTGYAYDLSFLSDNAGLRVSPDGRYISGLVSHCVSLAQPTLSLVGVPYNVLPFPMFEDQALFHSRVLSGVVSVPQLHRLRDLEAAEERADTAVPPKYRHKLMDRQWEYRRRLASLAAFPFPEPVRIEIYNDSRAARNRDIRNYRERLYKVWGDGPADWVVYEDGEDVAGKYEFDSLVSSAPGHP